MIVLKNIQLLKKTKLNTGNKKIKFKRLRLKKEIWFYLIKVFTIVILPKKIDNLDALWFQISDKKNGTKERILIDASFIPNDFKILDFLGSGKKILVLVI